MADLGHWVGKTNPLYQAHSDTSRLRRAILEYVRRMGVDGATDDDLYRAFVGYPPETVRVRRIELCKVRALEDSGQRRPTPTGCRATVWFPTTLTSIPPIPPRDNLESRTLRVVARLEALADQWRARKCYYAATVLKAVSGHIENVVAHETARAHEDQAGKSDRG